MVPFYSTIAKFVNREGNILQPWIQYLQQFTIAPPAFLDITIGASPFEYEAKEPGNVYIAGGTVSDISLIRGGESIVIQTSTASPRYIPVSVADIISVTYSIIPTSMKFVPNYGQNTTS